MCCCKEVDVVNSDFVTKFDYIQYYTIAIESCRNKTRKSQKLSLWIWLEESILIVDVHIEGIVIAFG